VNPAQPAPILAISAPNGIPPYLWMVILAAIVAALAGIGVHVQAPDGKPASIEPTPSTECECECATPATAPDLTTEPQLGTET
jgi:hypothetical protein